MLSLVVCGFGLVVNSPDSPNLCFVSSVLDNTLFNQTSDMFVGQNPRVDYPFSLSESSLSSHRSRNLSTIVGHLGREGNLNRISNWTHRDGLY